MIADATPQPPQQPTSSGTPLWVILLVVGSAVAFFVLIVIGVLVALLLPAIQAAREAARRAMCMNNLRQVGVAMLEYQEAYGSYPPDYLPDADGRPMHSWRVLLLPHLQDPEADEIYRQYRFDEPWDGPSNRRLAHWMPQIYACPSNDAPPGETNYVAVVGEETVWPPGRAINVTDIKDGMSNTIAVVEAAGQGINWLEPRDLTLDEAAQGVDQGETNFSSRHVGGANALFCDGHVDFLESSTPPAEVRAMLTRSGGEPVP